MGRKKITIRPIVDERNKQVTLNKRKLGLMKKAYELSVLCGCEIALVIFDSHNRNYIYASEAVGATLERQMHATEPIESHTNETIARLLNEKGKKSSLGAGLATPQPSHHSHHHQLLQQRPVPTAIAKLPSFTPGTEAKMRDIEDKYASYQRQQLLKAASAGMPSQSSFGSMSGLSATASASADFGGAGAAGAGGAQLSSQQQAQAQQQQQQAGAANSKLHNHGLRVHIPGSSKAFPPGTAPRPVPAVSMGGMDRPPSGSTSGSFFALNALSSIPTPSTLLPSGPNAVAFLPTIPTPGFPVGALSPNMFGLPGLPTPAILNLTAQSPGVINLPGAGGGAGDLHISSTAYNVHQHLAQMFTNHEAAQAAQAAQVMAAAAAGGDGGSSSSDEDEEEEDEEGEEEGEEAELGMGMGMGMGMGRHNGTAEDAAAAALQEMQSAASSSARKRSPSDTIDADLSVALKAAKGEL